MLKGLEWEACQLIGGSEPEKSCQGPSVKKKKDRLNASRMNRKLFFFFLLENGKQQQYLCLEGKQVLGCFLMLSKIKGQKVNLPNWLSATV